MEETEITVAEVEKLRRTKDRWRIIAIGAFVTLAAVLTVDIFRTRFLMNQISLERDRALEAERQADVQREESFRALLHAAEEATRYSQKQNALEKSK